MNWAGVIFPKAGILLALVAGLANGFAVAHGSADSAPEIRVDVRQVLRDGADHPVTLNDVQKIETLGVIPQAD